MTAVARRGWLIGALAVAVAVLLGSIVAVAVWGGDLGASGSGPGSGVTQFWGGDHDGPGMLGQNQGSATTSMQ